MSISAREAAFIALDTYFLQGVFIEESLNRLSPKDFGLAYELAAGVVRQKRALETAAAKVIALPKKRKEKILLYMVLYQQLFLDRIPDFAIGNEMVELAKKHTSPNFAKFLNAFIRNHKCTLDASKPSYSDFFITRIREAYGDKAEEVFAAGNIKPPLFARDRVEMKMVQLDGYIDSERYYVQNPAQFMLYSHLRKSVDVLPKRILDLAASPGGKLLLLHDFFPESILYANDISEKRVALIRENCKKYGMDATLTVSDGLDYRADAPFDLVIVDAPCSNSGCLYKCPEARWRLTKENVSEHAILQKKLIEKARSLITANGAIWYSTCSILPEENEEVVAAYNPITSLTILATQDGLEGGFGCVIK